MSLLGCERGTASVEIVVMLPVFILLFLGTLQMHSFGIARQEARSAARACAFHYAVHGCTPEAKADAICAGSEVSRAGDLKSEGADKETKQHESVLEAVAGWPVLGDLVIAVFGEGSHASAKRSARSFLSGEDRTVSGEFYIVCNTVSETLGDKAGDLMCKTAAQIHIAGPLKSLGLCP